MQNKHGSSIRSCDCYLKRCVKNGSTQYSFYVMESRVSNDCTFNIHRPSTPEKRGQPERKHRGKDCQKSTYAQTPISAKFHSITYCFAAKKIGIFRVRLIAFPIIEFPKLCWTVKHICALPSAC